jgi:hypothetical protein
MNRDAVRKLGDLELKREVLQRLAHGVLPFEQWANVFANPKLAEFPNLRGKAFSVWFTTPIDYLKDYRIIQDLVADATTRKLSLLSVPDLSAELRVHFAAILSLYNRDEQIFLRDRRLQCVHGVLNQYSNVNIGLDFFDSASGDVARITIATDQYAAAILPFYTNMQETIRTLLARMLASPEFAALADCFTNRLMPIPHLSALIADLGLNGKLNTP